MSLKLQLITSTFPILVVRALCAILTLLLTLLITARLDIGDAGLYFVAVSTVPIFATFCRLGLENIVVKKTAIIVSTASQNSFIRLYKTSLKVVIFASFLSSFVIICSVAVVYFFLISRDLFLVYDIQNRIMILYLSLSIPASAVLVLNSSFIQGFSKPSYAVFSASGSVSFFSIILILYADGIIGISSMVSIYFYSNALALILSFALLFRVYYKTNFRSDSEVEESYSDLISESRPLLVVNVSGQCVSNLPVLFLGFVDTTGVGSALLRIAQRLSEILNLGLVAINTFAAPRFANLYHAKNLDDLKSFYIDLRLITWMFLFPPVVFIMIYAKDILSYFGSSYLAAENLLRALLLGQSVNILVGSAGVLLTMAGYSGQIKKIVLANTILTLLCIVVFATQFGSLGVSIILGLGVAVQNVLLYANLKRYVFPNIDMR